MSSALHVHSMYSLLDGYSTPKENLEQAKKNWIKSIGCYRAWIGIFLGVL